MKITPLAQLRVEDFPKDEQKWLPQLFQPLNQFLTTVTTALQQNLAFNDNTLGQEMNAAFVWTSSAVNLPMKFKLTMKGIPGSLIVSQATENKTPVILLVAWQLLSGTVQITDIAKVSSGVVSSLVSGASYTLRVRVEV